MLFSQTRKSIPADRLRVEKDVRFVSRNEYCEMLICPRRLTRCDIPAERIRGIYDVESGIRFLIEEKLLFS